MYLYKYYRCSDEYTLTNIENNQLFFNHPSNLDDQLDCNLKIVGFDNNIIFDNRKQDFGIGCFSSVLSDYMWKKYADDGDGFCLVYERQELEKITKDIIKIDYYTEDIIYEKLKNGLKSYISSRMDKKIGYFLLIAACSYKRIEYSEEHEYRILSKESIVKNIKPLKIIAGNRVKEDIKKEIENFCFSNNIEFE